MKRFNLYITPHRASVCIENGVSRETAAPTVPQMIDGMADHDRRVLLLFCTNVVSYMNNPGNKAAAQDTLIKMVEE